MSWWEPGAEGAEDAEGVQDAERQTQLLRTRITRRLIDAVRDVPPASVPQALCRACVSLLPDVSGLSLSVLGRKAGMGVVLFASDGMAAQLAEIQYTLGEGPCTDAVRLRAPVFASDLTRAPDALRWPLFCVQAARAGAEAVFSVPLTAGASVLGTLDLYQGTPGPLDDEQVPTALLVADALSLAVTALDRTRNVSGSDGVVTWLKGAESDRVEIHQATGVIMVHLGVDAEEALLRLRARAFAQGTTSLDVARSIIDGSLDIRHE
ncbi:GAF and ANTAR domain-containing protein [Streptomyces apricus]|uniref:GAF and ANTAR domain-containing protein n=1 Tax=Streptomyces apricus TaxID=1828112 RepID=A0A5B0BGM1_9ACTN|nr:GAF and ANTAR domain-containing protein [Streptomyces apricus]KAA0940482.1 GAF and ANTAR domain-containing protein [Streptomyces apricus]